MEDTAIPYELPEAENHSFFFIDQRVEPRLEAKLHRHDAWELYHVLHGRGNRMAGDTLQPFEAGDVALIPPSMLHRWEYAAGSADENGCVRYLMVAFSHSLVKRCMEVFPELRNRLSGVMFPADALKFGPESSRIVRKALSEMNGMDELGRLSAMLRLLPVIFTSSDHTFAGRPVHIERDVRRMQQICAYVMKHYVHPIALDDIARLRSLRFERESEVLGPVGIAITQIEAGTQHNVVPDTCRFTVDVRTTDAYSNEETVALLRAAIRSEAVPRSTHLSASAVGDRHPLVRAARAAGRRTFVSPTLSDRASMPFPALKMGPGDSARSHTADEYVLLSQIEEGIDVYTTYIEKLALEYGKTLG